MASARRRLIPALVVAAPLVAAAPAGATITGAGVRAGHNVTVFHTIDFIATFGYSVGTPMTIDVLRGPHRIASVTADTGSTPNGGGLELNHGPLGPPQPGDCFVGFTPNVSPGDVIRVTADGGTDEITVDNVRIDQGATAQANGDVTLQGVAERFDGTPIPVAELNSGEVRNTSSFRGAPSEVIRTAGTAGGWTAIFRPPFIVDRNRAGLDEIGRKNAILLGSHAMGFGHLVPLPAETQVADGVGDTPGPALGCEAAPAAVSGIGASSVPALNVDAVAAAPATGDVALALSGPAAQGDSAGTIALSDGTATATAPAEGLTAGATGAQGWTARFTRAQIDALADGTLTATASFTSGPGVQRKIVKDTAAPTVTPDLAPGSYKGAQRVALAVAGADKVTYRLDGRAATASDTIYDGRPISLPPGDHALRTLAVDAAGNRSEATFAYSVAPAPAVVAPALPALALAGHAVVPQRVAAPSSRSLAPSALRAKVRARDVTVSMRLAAGTRALRLSVYRALRGGHLELAHRELRVPGRGGAYAVRLGTALAPGRYVLVATPGLSEARLSAADERTRAFRVKRNARAARGGRG